MPGPVVQATPGRERKGACPGVYAGSYETMLSAMTEMKPAGALVRQRDKLRLIHVGALAAVGAVELSKMLHHQVVIITGENQHNNSGGHDQHGNTRNQEPGAR